MSKHTWILERSVFSDNHDRLADCIVNSGHNVIDWDDDWWERQNWPELQNEKVIFHGSLGNASRIANELKWIPGSYCATKQFECTSWYRRASQWLIHKDWICTTANEFVNNPQKYLDQIKSDGTFFVRPNSPLKPFAGRVLHVSNLSLEALDYGFYFDDVNIQIIVTPIRKILDEFRFVVVKNQIIAGSSYVAETRTEIEESSTGDSWLYAADVAKNMPEPEDVYVMDVCNTDEGYSLLELNPFSGADLYACDRSSIVKAITNILA